MAYTSFGPDSPAEPAVEESPTESRRFGIRVGRLDYGLGTDWDRVDLARTLEADFDLVLLRYPAQRLDLTDQLRLTGRPIITADPLVYLRRGTAPQEHSPVDLHRLAPGDVAEVERVIAEIFDGYVTHYMVNPLTRDIDIIAAYQEWNRSILANNDGRVFIAQVDGVGTVGMCLLLHFDETVEVLLGGIVPAGRGRGWYQAMFRAITDYARAEGATTLVTATQASNIGSLRGFIGAGYAPELALTTVHVMRP